jgi:hypothetical protein
MNSAHSVAEPTDAELGRLGAIVADDLDKRRYAAAGFEQSYPNLIEGPL